MKKVVALVLTGMIILSAMLTGCSSKPQDVPAQAAPNEAPQPVELTLWHETEPAIADVISEQLKKLEPEIKVNVVRKEKVTEALKLVADDPASAPDLFWFAHDKIGLFATMGVLEPLDKWLPSEDFNSFIPMARQAGMYNGSTYQVPVYFETLLFMYNRKLLDKAPANTDELLAMMKEKTKGENYGYVEQHSTAYYAAAWINGFGGYIINEKGEPGLDKQETIDAVEYHKQFVDYMPKDGEWNTVTTLFNEGKAASTLNGPWAIPGAREKGIDVGFGAPPVISKVGKPIKPYAGVQGLMMLKASKHKEAAAKVLKTLMEKDLGEAMALATGAAPAHKGAYENPSIRDNELISAMKIAGENATPMPNVPEMDVMWTTTENALTAVNKKGSDAKTELLKQQAESLQRIADMK